MRVSALALRLAFKAADERFVNFHKFARAAHWIKRARAHGLAQTVRDEPRRLVGHLERAVQLVRADTLLAGRKQVRGLKPLVDRNVAALKNRAYLAGELLLAVATA